LDLEHGTKAVDITRWSETKVWQTPLGKSVAAGEDGFSFDDLTAKQLQQRRPKET
jgi:hypothetical protein